MTPLRFIHTSDIHLDTSFAGCGFPSRIGDRKREAIRATFRRIVEAARIDRADLILIAGDLFEHDRVTPDTIQFLKQQFESLGTVPVFIAPGNHDPYLRGSPYREEVWPDNVHIFREERFDSVELPDLGVRVSGFGFNRAQLDEHPFLKLVPMPNDAVNLVLAHGSNISSAPAGKAKHGPFSIEEIAGKNVHYCALGHYHHQQRIPNPIDETPVWYCGIPEGRGWDEEGACGYLWGEIDNNGVSVQNRPCNQYPLKTITIECDGFSSREQIIESLLEQRGLAFDAKTILRVKLVGSLDSRLDLSLGEMHARLSDEALHIQWEDETQPALDFASLALERTLRGRFSKALNERIKAASDEDRLVLERARFYGLQALLGREVRLR